MLNEEAENYIKQQAYMIFLNRLAEEMADKIYKAHKENIEESKKLDREFRNLVKTIK